MKSTFKSLDIPNYDKKNFEKLTEDGFIKIIGHDVDGRSLVLIRPSKMFLEKVTPENSTLYFYDSFLQALNTSSEETD